METPEYIEGIPTGKKRVKERFELIKSYYEDGTQRKNGYKNMILLYYQFENEQINYMNFTVKLTIGVNASQKHIQYSVNKVEVTK